MLRPQWLCDLRFRLDILTRIVSPVVFVLALVDVASQRLFGEETLKSSVPPRSVSVAEHWQFGVNPFSQQSEPGKFFAFGFDLARLPAPAAWADYSPDGKRLAIGMGWYNIGGDLVVWDLEKHREVFSVWLGLGIRCVEYSPDGKTIAISCFDQSAKLYDAETGERLAVLPVTESNGTNSVCFSPDGSTICTGGLHRFVDLWDSKTYEQIARLKGHHIRVYSARYSADGKRIVSADKSGIGIVWDAKTGEQISQLVGHHQGVELVDFTRDSKRVITAGWDGTLRFWDPETGMEKPHLQRDLRSIHHGVMALGTSPDGRLIASGGFGPQIELYDLVADKAVRFEHGQNAQTYGIRFSDDGREFATANFDGTVKRWDAKTHRLIESIHRRGADATDRPSPIVATAWSRDGSTIASAHADGTLRLRDGMSGSVQRTIPIQGVTQVLFGTDSDRLAVCTGDQMRLYAIDTGTEISAFGEPGIRCAALTADGSDVATGRSDGTIRLFHTGSHDDSTTLHDRASDASGSAIISLAIDPSKKWIVSGDDTGTVRSWSVDSHGSRMLMKTAERIVSVQTNRDGSRIAVLDFGGALTLFDTETWTESNQFDLAAQPTCFAWSPASRFIVSGHADGKIAIYDTETGSLIRERTQHRGAVGSLVYAPSGTAFLSAGTDGRLLRWMSIPNQRRLAH